MFKSIIQYFKESYQELRLVKWPTRSQMINDTIMVLLVCIFAAILLGGIDFGMNYLIQWYINK